MTNLGILRLALKQAGSDLRSMEWRALLMALILATSLASFLALLGHQLEKGLGQQSAAMLGADLSLSDNQPIQQNLLLQAQKLGLKSTQVVQFSTMISTGEQMLLSSVRAVNDPYPLRGRLTTLPEQSAAIPEPGNAWAEQALLDRIGISVGTTISLGYSQFKITAVLVSSPDRGTGFRSFSPQLLINQSDLAATKVVQPGSRIGYRSLFSGDKDGVTAFDELIQAQLTPQQRLLSVYSDQPMAEGAMQHASTFLRLSALFGLLLCGLMITLSLRRYSDAQLPRCALLKSLGMEQQHILKLYLFKLFNGWLLAAVLGCLISIGLIQLTEYLLRSLLPTGLPAADLEYYLNGPLLSLGLLLIIGLSPLIQMSRIPVMGLLRHDQLSQTALNNPARLLIFISLCGVLALYLGSPVTALLAIISIGLGTLLAGTVASFLLTPSATILARHFRLGRLLKYRLRQQQHWHKIQLGIMSLLLALLSSLLLSQNELVNRWQQQLPEDTPNQFVINIQPWELAPLSQYLKESKIDHQLFPMIRGRITLINDKPPAERLTTAQLQHNSLNRELNLSWSAKAPVYNEIVSGTWWPAQSNENLISIEQELAEALQLTLGDKLGFEVAGQRFDATVSNIRKVEWRSFRPNFYIIFSPAVLKNYPHTYITSFSTGEGQQKFSRNLLNTFPALTLIDVKQWIDQASQLIDQLIRAASLILGLTLLAGMMLVQLLLRQELEQRRHENALLQVLGSTRSQTRQLDLLEFSLLGGLSGTMAAALSELITGLLSYQLLELPLTLHPWLWISLPAGGALLFIVGTLLGRRQSGYQQLQQN